MQIIGFIRWVDQRTASTRRPTSEELDSVLERVWDELLKLDIEDPTVGACGEDGTFEIGLVLPALEPDEATMLAGARVRAAFHAAGAYTGGWDMKQTASTSQLVDA